MSDAFKMHATILPSFSHKLHICEQSHKKKLKMGRKDEDMF